MYTWRLPPTGTKPWCWMTTPFCTHKTHAYTYLAQNIMLTITHIRIFHVFQNNSNNTLFTSSSLQPRNILTINAM